MIGDFKMSKKKIEKYAINKNDEFVINIDDMGADGEGIGHADGYALFVKDALIGDIVRVKVIKTKKTYGYAKLLDIVESSPYRVEAKCSVAKQCGGCQLQHCSYEKQLELKQNKIKNCLERIGKFTNIDKCMEPIMGMENPFYYRNKAQFPVGQNKAGEIITGFYAGRTHCIIDTADCCIQSKVNKEILQKVKDYMKENQVNPYSEVSHQGLVRHILTRVSDTTKEIMVCLIINGEELPHSEKLVEKLITIPGMKSISFNINKEKTNVILGTKVVNIWGENYITDQIQNMKYQISPLSFYQVNSKQTVKLYNTALEYANLQGREIVWDLYCGIGTISLFLAQKAKKVYGVEIVPQAIEDAKRNAALNEIDNVEFFVGAAEDIVPEKYAQKKEEMKADVVVVDPPRKGCDTKLLDTLLEMEPDRIVYVSCDPATLARDLRYLCDRKYELKRVRGCDMFGQSGHVENCCLLEKRDL